MKKKLTDISGVDYEYTIVGTGPAGISLALGLSKNGKKVLLLEGGGYEYTEKSQSIYDGKVVGNTNYDIRASRLRYFGGSSNHWSGRCRPLDEVDLKKFPISKKDLDPYLGEASNILEIDGKFNKDRLVNREFRQIEFQFSQVGTGSGYRLPVSFNEKYKKHIEQSNLIDLILNANVLSIREGEGGGTLGTAKYVEVAGDESLRHKVKINKLIVACGGIENSRLLLWSQHVNKRLFSYLSIGNKWMEHPNFVTAKIIGNTMLDERFGSDLGERFGSDLMDRRSGFTPSERHFSPTESMMNENDIDNAGILIKKMLTVSELKQLIKDILCVAPDYGKKLMALAGKHLLCGISVETAWEQRPYDDNRIELDYDNKDSYGVPRVKLKWKLSQRDKKTPRICMQRLGQLFIEKDIGRVGMLPYLGNNDDFPQEFPGMMHHIGGTPMSISSKTGVVDENLKVFNVDNVWLAGSSVFSAAGHANPTLTIVQLSLRLADHLVKSEK